MITSQIPFLVNYLLRSGIVFPLVSAMIHCKTNQLQLELQHDGLSLSITVAHAE